MADLILPLSRAARCEEFWGGMEKSQLRYLEVLRLRCADIEALLDHYLDREIIPALERRFESHLEECESCSELVSDCQRLIELAKTLDEDPIPPAVHTRLREVLRDQCGYDPPQRGLKLIKRPQQN